MFPIRDHNPSERTPFVTYALIALNVGVFLSYVGLFDDPRRIAAFFGAYAATPAELTAGRELHTVVTSMFLHGGWLHLLGNMLFLYIFGDNLEDAFGHVRFLGFYLACGALAVAAQAVPDPGSTVPMVGASGAIAGVMGAYLLLYPRARVDVLVIIVIIVRIIPLPAFVMLGVWFGLQALGGFYAGRGEGGVAYLAHLGGFAAGVAFALPYWLARGGPAYWRRLHGHPPHPEAPPRLRPSSIPKVRRRRWSRSELPARIGFRRLPGATSAAGAPRRQKPRPPVRRTRGPLLGGMTMMRFARPFACAVLGLALAGPAAAQDRDDWPSDLTIGTASQGGVYFVYGNGLAAFLAEELGVNASGEVTGGPVQNVTLVQTGDHQIGLVTLGPMYEARTGVSELAPGLEHSDVRALFPMYETPFQGVALRSSGIASAADLAGRRVSVGPAGGTPGTYWPRFLEALGVSANVSYAGAADAASQLQDGLIDAFAFAAGLPIGAFSQLAAEADVVTFGFTEAEQATLLETFPEVAAFTIPGGTYTVQPDDQQSVAMWNFAVVHQDMPESLAYEITKTVMENHDRMMQIHAAAATTLLENWNNNTFLPFHPGAVRYMEEQGIEVPEELRG